ncbi:MULTISPECIES: hypothetical protein [unclassified Mesorhizobium]|uniref:amino acid kinase family protein n=1 Tax=unclassified Mesorhizobium TaxID=325217 RepID=UPI0033358685
MVKIGSALIGDAENGEMHGPWLETLIEDVVRFSALGQQMIIVTSGAAAVGSSHFNHLDRSLPVEEKQTAAAIRQVQLRRAYEQSFDPARARSAHLRHVGCTWLRADLSRLRSEAHPLR